MHPNGIKFSFDETKATQAAALLLKRTEGSMKYMGLLKLLYLADREALKEIERSITGDHYVSMKYGPVLSCVNNLMTEEITPKDYWEQYISAPTGYSVKLLEDPGKDELCEMEEEILNKVFDTYGHMDRFKLAELTHEICPEWEAPQEGGPGALPITIESILEAVGKTPDEVDALSEELREERVLHVITADPQSQSK